MEVNCSIECPFCGEGMDVLVETGLGSQCFTTDCENCCRPMEVRVECEPGEILSLAISAG